MNLRIRRLRRYEGTGMIVNLGADRHMMKRLMFLGAATTVIAMTVPATQAQDAAVTKRVDRLEKEMRAVQRQVQEEAIEVRIIDRLLAQDHRNVGVQAIRCAAFLDNDQGP